MVVFGVTLATAIWVFSKNNVSAHRDLLVSAISHIASDAVQYRHRPKPSGGGGSFAGYQVPQRLLESEHATLSAKDSAGYVLTILATSTHGLGSVSARVRGDGALGNFSYTGEFAD
jgi:hypothetical protein